MPEIFIHDTLLQLFTQFCDLKYSYDFLVRYEEGSRIREEFARCVSDIRINSPYENNKLIDQIETGFNSLFSDFTEKTKAFNEKHGKISVDERISKKDDLMNQLRGCQDLSTYNRICSEWRSIGRIPNSDYRFEDDCFSLAAENCFKRIDKSREQKEIVYQANSQKYNSICEAAESLLRNFDPVLSYDRLQELDIERKGICPMDEDVLKCAFKRYHDASMQIELRYSQYIESLRSDISIAYGGRQYERRDGVVVGIKQSCLVLWDLKGKRFYQSKACLSDYSLDSDSFSVGDIVLFYTLKDSSLTDCPIVSEMADNNSLNVAVYIIKNNEDYAGCSFDRNILERQAKLIADSDNYISSEHKKCLFDLIKTVDSLEIDSIIDSYEVIIKESVRQKTGDDDTYFYEEYTKSIYSDHYLEKFLPIYRIERDERFYGGPEPGISLEEKQQIQTTVEERKNTAREQYNRDAHIEDLVNDYVNTKILQAVVHESRTGLLSLLVYYKSHEKRGISDTVSNLNSCLADFQYD